MAAHQYILGTGLSHDGSACLMKDGRIVVAIEKERLSRRKHDGGNDSLATQYCLDAAGITVRDLALIVQCANFEKDEISISRYKGRRIFPADLDVPVRTISHHLAHAWSAVGTSPFAESHVLVLDGSGSPSAHCDDLAGAVNLAGDEMQRATGIIHCEKDSFYSYRNGVLQPLIKDFSVLDLAGRPHALSPFTIRDSIGGLYCAVSHYCFGNIDDAGKLMGLAAYGRKEAHRDQIFDGRDGRIFLREDWMAKFDRPAADFAMFKSNFQYYADLAALVQRQVEEAILYIVKDRVSRTGAVNLSYSGGVALNALANTRIRSEGGVRDVHITPAAGDNGLALGCAWYGWHEVLKKERAPASRSSCFGRNYARDEIEQAVARTPPGVCLKRPSDLVAATAALLDEGKVVGWFQGESEFGPRALGRRSILADPRRAGVRDFINREIKCREDFRPFAPAVLAEDAGLYFENGYESPYMLLVDRIRPEWKEILPSVVHADGTCRLQTVTPDWNALFHELLIEFRKRSGIGVLINTSMNRRGMPMVESPSHALEFFLSSQLDCLVLQHLILEKKESTEPRDDLASLQPSQSSGHPWLTAPTNPT